MEVMCPNHGDDYTITELNPMEWKCNNVLQDSKRVPILDSKEFQGHNEFLSKIWKNTCLLSLAAFKHLLAIVLVPGPLDRALLTPTSAFPPLEEMEAVMIIDILRRTKANVVVASDGDNLEILASSKVKLVTDMLLDEAAKLTYDLVVLPGKKATAYPAMCDKLSDQSHIDNRVVVDGNLITSRGPGTSIEFALGIVEKFFGRPKALELAKGLLVVRK
ncbi:Chaperone YajL [Gossypium arboreum]|uniref:Chaperone YajL n=1 Tax=Gossypium arboreum TaxID=29729 RepID=A0A0B0PRH7_GOSAR|nr:Chaperone YajL [Gossypium arboreum]